MGLPVITVEIAFATDPTATPTWTDVSAYWRHIHTHRGRSFELDRVEAGWAEIVLRNGDGRFDPTFTSGAYYPNVKLRRRIRIQATWNAVTYNLFNGYVTRWPQEWTPTAKGDAKVTLRAVDGFLPLGVGRFSTTRSAEASGTRVGAILDAISWPAADRAIDTGVSIVQAKTYDAERALSALQEVSQTEGGVLFMSGDGKVTFYDRTKLILDTLDATNYTWGDAVGEKGYVTADHDLEDSLLYNEVIVSAPGKTDQVASDTASQTRYFLSTLPLSTVHNDQNDMLSRAQYLVTRYAEPAPRVTSIVMDARGEDTWQRMLDRELHSKLRARIRPIGPGNLIEQDSFIGSIDHDIFPKQRWITTMSLSPVDLTTEYWVIGDAALSLVGETTRLYY